MRRLPGCLGTLTAVFLLMICVCSSVIAYDSGSPIGHHLTPSYQRIEAGGTAALHLQSRDLDYFHGVYYTDQLAFTAPDDDEPSPANEWTATELQRSETGWYTQTYTKIFTHLGTLTCAITADDTPGWNNDDPVTKDVTIEVVDTTPPTPGTASSPSYVGEGPISVTYSGASDTTSGLAKVELWYKIGHTGTWAYSGYQSTGSSGSFSFPVTEENTYYFDLVAEDNAENRSAAPTDDGDCHTIYETGLSATGRSFMHNEYLYPGGPLIRTTVHSESGSQVREVTQSYGEEGELLGLSGSAESATYAYDAAYRIKSITDAANRTTSYVYDDDGDPNTEDPRVGYLCRVEYPGAEVVTYSDHDAYGRPLTCTDANSVVTRFLYDDPDGLLTDLQYPATPAMNIHYEYDPVYGRLTSVTDGAGLTSYTSYDDLDLLLSVTTTYTDMQAKTMQFERWPNGSLKTITTPAGDFSYTYDAAGRPTGLANPFSQDFSWSYLDNNWLDTQTTPVSSTSYAHNPRGFLTSLTNRKTDQSLLSEYTGPAPDLKMDYDTVGNLLSMTVNIPNVAAQYSGVTDYSYQASRSQLLHEQSTRNGAYSYDFAYDAMGNPTTFEGATRIYNNRNQSTAAGFVYDSNGDPTTYKGQTLVFDADNRMTSFGTALTAGYTGGGVRVWKQSASGRTYFLYAGSTPVCELNSDGDVIAVNTFGPTGFLARREGSPMEGSDRFYTFDPQGSVSQILDASGNVLSTQLYDAFGSSLYGSPALPYGFGAQYGYYTDQETGLQLLSHRYYDPEEGRFLTRDPIGYAGGQNLYAYVQNNPVNAVDPSGYCSEGGWGHNIARLAAEGAAMADADELDRVGPGGLGWLKAGAKMTLNDLGAGLFSILDFGTGSGRVAGGDYSAEAIIGAVGDAATVATVGAGIYARAAAGAATGTEWTLQETAAYGRNIHGATRAVCDEAGIVGNRATIPGSRLRPDGTDFANKAIHELKPDTDSGVRAMNAAQKKYMNALEQAYGNDHGWTFKPQYYDAPWKK